jgi:hypothetical protein
MEVLYEYRSQMLSRFAVIASEIAAAFEQIPPDARFTPLEPGGWSPHQVLAHLRDVEARAYASRFDRILREDCPALEAFDQTGWMREHYTPGEAAQQILSEYSDLRAKALERLKTITPADWSRSGRHPQWGTRTLQWWVEHSLAHAEEHLRQMRSFQQKARPHSLRTNE